MPIFYDTKCDSGPGKAPDDLGKSKSSLTLVWGPGTEDTFGGKTRISFGHVVTLPSSNPYHAAVRETGTGELTFR